MKAPQLGANWVRLSFGAIGLALTLGLAACGGGGSTNDAGTVDATKQALSAVVAPGVSVIAVTKVSETRVSRTVYDYVFKVTVQNGNLAQMGVTANLTAVGTGTSIMDGSAVIGDMNANALLTSTDTITLRHDRTFAFDQGTLRWSVTSTASAGTLADAHLTNVGIGANADGIIYAIAGADLNNPITFATDGNSPGDQFNLLMSCGAPKLNVANVDSAWRLVAKGLDMVVGLPIDGCLRIVNQTAGKFIDVAFKAVPLSPAKTASVSIAPMGTANFTTTGGYFVEFSRNTSGATIVANVFEAVLPDGSLKLVVTFNADVRNAGITVQLPDMNAPAAVRVALSARKSLAASSTAALPTAAGLAAYPNNNENLGSDWKHFSAWTDETAMRIPDKIAAQNGVTTNKPDVRYLIVSTPSSLFSTSILTIYNREVSALYSVLPAMSQVRPADEEVVIFINGFQLAPDFSSDFLYLSHVAPIKIGGGKDTWGEFPRLAMDPKLFGGKQLIPFEFRWATNARFADVADDLAKSINLINASLGTRKIHLVAHSFGGLVVRTLVQGLSTSRTETATAQAIGLVSSVLTLGTPHSGIQATASNSLPNGQDAIDGIVPMKGFCGQVTCYEAGAGGSLSDTQLTLLYGSYQFAYFPGWLPTQLTVPPLPDIPFYVGIGLRSNSDIGNAGDRLISYEGQRFSPQLRSTPLLGISDFFNPENGVQTVPFLGAKVRESILGSDLRSLADRPSLTGLAPIVFPAPRTKGYGHQGTVANTVLSVLPGVVADNDGGSLHWGLEASIQGQCGVGQESICNHASLALFRELVGKPPAPTVTLLSPGSLVANNIAQPIAITGKNFRSNSVIQKRSGFDSWVTVPNWVTEPNPDPGNLVSSTQITVMVNPGTATNVFGIRVCRGGYVITDVDCSAEFGVTATVLPQTQVFREDFNGSALQTSYWTAFGPGTVSVANGTMNTSCRSGVSTQNKVTFSGNKIVIEGRMGGSGSLRDSNFFLIDANNGEQIAAGDTNYQGKGLYAYGSGAFALAQTGNGNSIAGLQEFRLTLEGTSLKLERGSSLSGSLETITRTLGSTVAGRTFFLILGTGGADYCPGTYDWVQITATTVNVPPLPTVFSDDFNGVTLDPLKWTSRPYIPGYGDPTVGSGLVHFANCQSADTLGKVSITGAKIVIESRFAGQKPDGRDSHISLIDPATNSTVQIGDTSYSGWGIYLHVTLNGVPGPLLHLGGTTAAFKEYRITLDGINVTIERGDTLNNLTEKYTAITSRSITTGATYYLRAGTGGCDGVYSPADFDWIRVNTF